MGQSAGVSVVLPAYNVGPAIQSTVEALAAELRGLGPGLELVIVDDGSTDGTATAAVALCERRDDVRVLRNRRNLGKGLAVYLGVIAARHSTVCFTDADLAFLPGSYARVVSAVRADRPFVVGSRRLAGSEIHVRMAVLGYAARRHVVGVTFNRCVRAALRLPFHDTQCGLKAFDRLTGLELFRRMRAPRFLFDIELFAAARALGIAVEEVPVGVVYNDFKSSVRLIQESARMLGGLAGIAVRHWRGAYAEPNPAMDPDRVRHLADELTGNSVRPEAADPRPLPVAG